MLLDAGPILFIWEGEVRFLYYEQSEADLHLRVMVYQYQGTRYLIFVSSSSHPPMLPVDILQKVRS